MTRKRQRWLMVFLAGALALSGAARAQTVTDSSLTITPVVDGGLDQPTTLAFVGPNDFLVLEKTGRVRRVLNNSLQQTAVRTFNVNTSSERGLLGIAVNGASPRQVFLYVTEAATPEGTPIANRVYRYDWNPAGAGSLTNQALLLELPVTPGPNHNAGVLTLGPPGQFPGVGDGAALFVTIGDLNRNGQLQNNTTGSAPDDTGVIFRVLQDGSPAPGNPFAGPVISRYWGYGVRNSFGLTVDPETGSLWDTENGPSSMDEVNRVTAGSNSGWNDIMGPDALDPQNTDDLFDMPGAGLTYSDPEFSWAQVVAPTGILFPVGSSLGAAYDQMALVGDNNFGNLYALPLNAGRTGFALSGMLADLVADNQTEANLVRLGQEFGPVTDLELGPDGHVYVVDIGGGRILRIAGPRGTADGDQDGISDSVDNCPTVANANQLDSDADTVGNACDNCVSVQNPRVNMALLTAGASANTNLVWATVTGAQRDDDHDGYGNSCDADFTPTGLNVGTQDIAQFNASSGKSRIGDTCGTSGAQPCARYDLDEGAGLNIGSPDRARLNALVGLPAGGASPAGSGKCPACPLPCVAGSAGSCF